MEKKTSKMTTVKAEPLAAGKVITVDVDPEALNCPKCVRPLAPPVFEVRTYETIISIKLCIADLTCTICCIRTVRGWTPGLFILP
jgi:hypothetical protein